MSDFPQMRLSQQTSQIQTQIQKMSQSQILAMNLLAMPSADLRNEIYDKAAKNPALEIQADSLEEGAKTARQSQTNYFSDDFHYGKAGSSKIQASDNFQKALENNEDWREPLSDHLEHQLNSMPLSQEEAELCKKLVYNLGEKGFHILSPSALLNKSNPRENQELLEKCIEIVQNLDPVGTCTANFQESLMVQAKALGNVSDCTAFLLEHFDYLNPPQTEKIQKKIKNYFSEQEKLKFNKIEEFDFSQEEIENALNFIKKLDPFPARNYGTSQTAFVFPDVRIFKTEEGISVEMVKGLLPKVTVADDYQKLVEETQIQDGDTSVLAERKKAELKFARNSINDAKSFIESLEFRQNTIFEACKIIAEIQKPFFEKGPGNLVPLRQKDIAEKVKVHETTVSRMANSKYIECDWGIFPVSYFFTNAVGTAKSDQVQENEENSNQPENSQLLSKESVKFEIQKLLELHKNDKKAPSDQKISDWLSEKGIKVARRTVAKYRTELNLGSSYER